ncbi:cyclin domain-containing protein [Loa loa]|uniref:Cyclin domain-containing protein n=1 Tax=Loa loa TaxID=7209 RepID=A0A1I7VZR2_LOALO|nr:cyclin domain-containing protein [Loa loa]EFO27940.2 cyclin domain-containing protein [Loa loa]
MSMHKRLSKRNAYQLLLMHNSLLSMAKVGTSGNRKSEYGDKLDGRNESLPQDIPCSEEECQQSEGKFEVAKTDYYDKLVVNVEALMSKQLCQTREVNVDSSETINMKLNSTRAGETSVRSLRRSPRRSYISTSAQNEEKSEQNVKELTSHQKFLKLCNIKNHRYFLVSDESKMPVVAFSHLPYNREQLTPSYSQSEDCDRLGVVSFFHGRIKPINYKHMQELSFRDLISTNVGSTSYLSKDSSPFRKHFNGDDKSSIVIYPSISTRWHILSCDKIIGRTEEESLLLHSTICDSSGKNSTEYDPNLIANFDSDCRIRKTVMKFYGYVSTVMHYQPDSEVKRLVNEAFRSRFPHVHVSFSKINSIKRELHQIAVACNLEDTTTAHAYVFYEKVLLKGLVCKMNRKLVAGAALLIAAKITDFGSTYISDVVNHLESTLRVNRKELLRYEIPLCAALSFNLRVPVWQLLPHYQRIALTIL